MLTITKKYLNFAFKKKHWLHIIVNFLTGQGSLQLLNALSGFLLLRWLSIEQYAQFSIAFGLQSALTILVDLGFAGSVVALVGNRTGDRFVIGQYIAAAKHFRTRLYLFLIPVCSLTFFLIVSKYEWSIETQLLLLASTLSSVFFQGWIAFYTAPLIMHRKIKQLYTPQVFISVLKLALISVFYFFSLMYSWTMAWINSLVLIANGYMLRHKSTNLFIESNKSDKECRKEMLQYIAPKLPSTIFYALQGQISLAIITIFGNTNNIAEVAALGRLGQLFLMLNTFSFIVIGPYMAKVSSKDLFKKYSAFTFIIILFGIFISATAFIFPEFFLWLSGSNYQNLKREVPLSIISASLLYISSTLYLMNSNRRWVYWWSSIMEIVIIVIIQVAAVIFMDLTNTIDVLYFSLFNAAGYVLSNLIVGIYGLVKNMHHLKSLKFKFT